MFDEPIREADLRDLVLSNSKFTWSNFREVAKRRIDRFLVTNGWDNLFNEVRHEVGVRACSDHFPLILDAEPVNWGPSPFCFENMWLDHPCFRKECERWWGNLNPDSWEGFKIMEMLKGMRYKIKIWNKESFGHTM